MNGACAGVPTPPTSALRALMPPHETVEDMAPPLLGIAANRNCPFLYTIE